MCIVLYISNEINKRLFHKSFFTTSFSEGNVLSTLTIIARSDLNYLNSDSDLTSKTVNNEQTTYIFASSDFKKLQDLEMSVRSNEMVISMQLNR